MQTFESKRLYISSRALPGEWDVHGGPDDGMRLTLTSAQPYPGEGRVNFTLEEWEREINACAGHVRNFNRLPSRTTYRAFVEMLRSQHESQMRILQQRIARYTEKGDTLSAEIAARYIADFVPPLGACYWNDGWQCTSHAEMMQEDAG